jgi:predicted ATP-grasp superfamily ATP-dependent carboligase
MTLPLSSPRNEAPVNESRPEAVVVGLSLNGLGVVRGLGRAGVRVVAVDRDPPEHTARSRYVRRRVACEQLDGPPLVQCLRELGEEARRALFLTSDQQVQTIADHRVELEDRYDIALPPVDIVHLLLDKTPFLARAAAGGFDVPASRQAASDDDLEAAVADVGCPCVVKPVAKAPGFLATFHEKGIVCEAPEDTQRVRSGNYDYAVPLTVQEWIPGGDGAVVFVLHYFDRDSQPLVSFAGRKIRQSPPIAGHTASCRPIDDPRAVEISEAFFRSVGAVGLCSMEFKNPPGTDRYAMIEPTVGRTDWQSAVAHVNGVPIVRTAYEDLCGLPPSPIPERRVNRVWIDFEADVRSALFYRRRGELGLAAWLRSIWPPRPAVWSLLDPWPFFGYARSLIGRVLGKLWRRRKTP